MAEDLNGYPAWVVRYDEHGVGDPGAIHQLLEAVQALGLRNLFIISHGWNNNERMACRLYERFFGEIADTARARRIDLAIGVVGIIWPSMRWPDETPEEGPVAGAASLSDEDQADDATVIDELRQIYPDPEARRALDEIEQLLGDEPDDRPALTRFQELLGILAAGPDVAEAPEDNGDQVLLEVPPEELFEAAAEVASDERREGAAMLGLPPNPWRGARQALRQATYWKMKKRAGIVGAIGLAPLVMKLARSRPDIRVHLVGHSFGGRLVSYCLKGLPETYSGGDSPIKSLLLLQGAFSHFAFAPALPHEPDRAGGLAGLQRRVDGPVLVTHSKLDLAVGDLYPWASLLRRDDASAATDRRYRWGAMGHDGAQTSGQDDLFLEPTGHTYSFKPGHIYNLDANSVIVEGHGPSGAHSDIFHPELAWVTMSGAGLV